MNNFNRTLVLACILTMSGVAQRVSDAERDLEAAVNKEVVQGDVNSAIGLYRKILSRYGSQREIAAKALFHLGQCHERLGQAEARKSYERIVNEFAEQKDLAGQARSRLAALGRAVTDGAVRMRRVFEPSDDCGYISQDDQWATCRRNGDLYVRNISSGKEMLIADVKSRPAASVLSGDGRWVAYTSAITYPYTLWLVPASGSPGRKLEGPTNMRGLLGFKFSSDNKQLLAFYELEGSGLEIWLHSVPGGESRKIHAAPGLRTAVGTLSPDSQFVVYRAWNASSRDSQILVSPVSGGEPWKLPTLPEETPVGFTADGKLVLHSSERGGGPSLWTMSLRQGHAEGQPQLLARGLSKEHPGLYHASGKYYTSLNISRFELLSAQLSGTSELKTQHVTGRNEGQGIAPDYSKDGKMLAFVQRNQESGNVIIRNLETGSETEHHSSLTFVYGVRWYPDGKALLVFGDRGKQQDGVCVRLDISTGEVSNVFTGMGRTDASTNPTLSPDGRYLYYKRFVDFDTLSYEGMRVYRFDLRTREDKEAYRAPAGSYVRLFAISSDGTQIAVGGREKKASWFGVAPLAGGETKVVFRAPENVGVRAYNALAWAVDGKSIIYHTTNFPKDGDTLWRLSLDGSPAQRLLTTTKVIWNIAVDPNGREIALDSRAYGREVWVMEGLK